MRKVHIMSNTLLNLFFVKKKKRISVYGYEQLNDNTRSLIEFIIMNKKYNCYEIILVSKENPIKSSRIKHIDNKVLGLLFLFRSKYVFHAQGMGKATFKSFYGQKIINIWHGTPLKSIGNNIKSDKSNTYKVYDDFCVVPSNFFKEIYMKSFGYKKNQLLVAGNPRNDYLYLKEDLHKKLNINNTNQILLFMPTFRKSNNNQYNDSSIDFPIFREDNIAILNNKLKELKQLLIFKPHPYQMKSEIFNHSYSNIKVISDSQLDEIDLRLYSLIGSCDALITDYSSVFFDFLLLDKPIGFTIEDIEEYKLKRGFSIENPEALMAGKKIINENDFSCFLEDVSTKNDIYAEKRRKINNVVNEYRGKQNTEFLLQKVGVSEEEYEY